MKKRRDALKLQQFEADLAILIAVRRKYNIQGPMTIRDIADVVGCSPAYIRYLEQEALKKLRHPSRLKLLTEG